MGFERVKRKYKLRAAILGAAGGVCLGLAATGILLIALKLSAIVWGWYLYLITGVCVAAAGAAALYFILKPSDKNLAKKLDSMYGLDEQAQTMVEFAGQDGAVIELQRQTADEAIANLPKRRPNATGIIVKAAAVVVAAILIVLGIVTPQRRIQIIEEPPYTVDESKLALLGNLIEDVQGDSALDETVQAAYTQELNSLAENLNSEDLSESLVTTYVQNSMYNISDITIDANTYDDVARVLSNSNIDGVEFIAEAIRGAAKASSEANIDLTSFDNLGKTAQNKIATLAGGYLESAGDTFTQAVNAMADGTVNSVLDPYISAIESVLKDESLSKYYAALITDGGLTFGRKRTDSSGDVLYDRMYDLYYIFYTASARFKGELAPTYSTASQVIKFILNDGSETTENNIYDFVINAGNALQTQAYTYLSDAYIRYTLGSIFGVTVVGNSADDGADASSDSGDDDGGSGGGGGTGETIYPGDDMIYNPSTGGYSYYYEMLTDADDGYLTRLYELLESDDVSDEVKNYIRTYIDNLL